MRGCRLEFAAPAPAGKRADGGALLPELGAVPGVDVLAGLANVLDDREKYLELVGSLVDSIPSRLSACRHAVESGDREAARHEAHSLKGAGGTLGLVAIAEAAAVVESKLRQLDGLEAHGDTIRAGLDALGALAAELANAVELEQRAGMGDGVES